MEILRVCVGRCGESVRHKQAGVAGYGTPPLSPSCARLLGCSGSSGNPGRSVPPSLAKAGYSVSARMQTERSICNRNTEG